MHLRQFIETLSSCFSSFVKFSPVMMDPQSYSPSILEVFLKYYWFVPLSYIPLISNKGGHFLFTSSWAICTSLCLFAFRPMPQYFLVCTAEGPGPQEVLFSMLQCQLDSGWVWLMGDTEGKKAGRSQWFLSSFTYLRLHPLLLQLWLCLTTMAPAFTG